MPGEQRPLPRPCRSERLGNLPGPQHDSERVQMAAAAPDGVTSKTTSPRLAFRLGQSPRGHNLKSRVSLPITTLTGFESLGTRDSDVQVGCQDDGPTAAFR